MNDMKLILKVMGCSANKKTGLLFVAVTLAMIVLGIFDRESNMSFVSGVLMVTLASWIPQALMSVDLTHMMAASPKRRRLYSLDEQRGQNAYGCCHHHNRNVFS